MKRLLFTELYLLSLKERKAKILRFHPRMTIIKGNNSTGKSCLLKMIYHAMGASVPNIPERFKNAEVISLLYFMVDGVNYRILRNRDQFTLFRGNDLILKTTHVTQELAPAFADLFNFKLQLRNRQSESSQATPAFLFLPFYLDQDQGWHKAFASLNNLGQFSSWTDDFLKFHLGICPSEYYIEKTKRNKLQNELDDCLARRDVIRRTRENILKKVSRGAVFDINIEDFKSAIAHLIEEANKLKQKEDKYLARRFELNNEIRVLNAQKIILKKARTELQKDFFYSGTNLPDEVECPLCHTVHDNSFAIRFNLAIDEYRCTEILQEIEIRLFECQRELLSLENEISRANFEVSEINRCLQETKNEVSLDQVINISGQKQVNAIFDTELDSMDSECRAIEEKLSKSDEELAKIVDSDRQKSIFDSFSEKIKANYRELNLLGRALAHKGYKCDCPKESGSDKTRLIFGYFLAFISTIEAQTSSCFCPIVIDSPRQNDVDQKHWLLMLKLLKKELSSESQCILSLVEHDSVDFEGSEIVLDVSEQLLNDDDFSQAYSTIISLENNQE